jgi:integrase
MATPRSASLRVAHSRGCANASRSSLDSLEECTCKPSYYTFHRDEEGRVTKSARVRDRRVAERALMKLQIEIDEGRVGVRRPKDESFERWAEKYEEIVAARVRSGELHSRTLTSYKHTLAKAKKSFGHVPLRRVGQAELRDFFDTLAELKPASRLSHLSELGACFSEALARDLIEQNPVAAFRRRLRGKVKAPKRGKAPFEDAELERLWQELLKPIEFKRGNEREEPAYLYASKLAAESGLRIGELVALEWPNVNLLDGTILVEYQHSAGELIDPKDREPRRIYLTTEARAVLEEWVRVTGTRKEGPVFPHPETGGRMERRLLQRRFEKAMEVAGIPKLHPELRLLRSFHSLRYTTSVLMQRRGYHPRLIEATLGHGTLELTYGVYGGWTPAMLAEAARRPAQQD